MPTCSSGDWHADPEAPYLKEVTPEKTAWWILLYLDLRRVLPAEKSNFHDLDAETLEAVPECSTILEAAFGADGRALDKSDRALALVLDITAGFSELVKKICGLAASVDLKEREYGLESRLIELSEGDRALSTHLLLFCAMLAVRCLARILLHSAECRSSVSRRRVTGRHGRDHRD